MEDALEPVRPLRLLEPTGIEILDQTLLPGEERHLLLADLDTVCEAIRTLRVRGAPLLGLVGAAGMALAGTTLGTGDRSLHNAARALIATRPTAADLALRVNEALAAAQAAGPRAEARQAALWRHANWLQSLQEQEDTALGEQGARLLPAASAVLTHCNTGSLATGGIGTALGVIRCAWHAGLLERCYVTETRPLLQGARLTAWELHRLRIPATLLPDTAAASLIASGRIHAVITGADRIAANGDTANKVGTYGLALAAARHTVPFYIAAPPSTFDPSCPNGTAIPIEMRADSEVGGFGGQRWSPAGLPAYNPAFDVTPAELITAIITPRAVLRPPYTQAILTILSER